MRAARTVYRAEVTGFKFGDPSHGTAGPVSVVLNGAAAARIDRIVSSLPRISPGMCMEDVLLYQITFTSVAGPRQSFHVAGWGCNANVNVTVDGKTTTRRDIHCVLLLAIRRVVPAKAATTQHQAAGCVGYP